MKLYHGSGVSGITELKPFLSGHGKPYVYLTHSEELATIYAHNPIPGGGWFTYRWSGDGRLHYDEYFPDALRTIYQGKSGWVYTCEETLPAMEKMPWVYLSEKPVSVMETRFIPDLYKCLLQYESAGKLIIHRWETIPDRAKASFDECILQSVRDHHLPEQPGDPYLQFIRTYRPEALQGL